MTSDAHLIREWYKTIKENSACITCQHEGQPAEAGKVEFHHIDASSKCDTLSNMAIRPLIPCLQYTVQPVTFAVELMKVAPLCSDHHRELHRADDKGDTRTMRDKFDLTGDPFYQAQIKEFRTAGMALAPPALINRINDGLLDMLHDGQVVFTENGFELASQRVNANDNQLIRQSVDILLHQ